MAIYDISLGGIDLPAHENDFSEHLGSDYEAVGSAVLPGAPAPVATYDMTIDVYGDPSETDPTGVGLTKRLQVRALLQNPAARFAGLELVSVADPDINGYLVIGTADLAYGDSGPGFGDFKLSIRGAAWIPAVQSLVGLRLLAQDRNEPHVALDSRGTVLRAPAARGKPEVAHYLPPGATHVRGQAAPQLPTAVQGAPTYETLYGPGHKLIGRPGGEVVRYAVPWAQASQGNVRVWDTNGNPAPTTDAASDQAPQLGYRWVQVYGATQVLGPGVPALDNGRCRLRHLHGSTWAYETASGGRYHMRGHLSLGYGEVLHAAVASWTPDRAELLVELAGGNDYGVAHIALERGWPGPHVDVYHQGRMRPLTAEGYQAYLDAEGGWEHVQLGATQAQAQVAASTRRLVGHR